MAFSELKLQDLEKVDIVAFGAHPDDVEIGCGGLLAKEVALGYKVGIVDLTQGEMGTNGTIEERAAEAQKAAEILGATWRKNLKIPDRHVDKSEENLAKVVEVIRTAQPKLILMPYWNDRHPDHVNASNLVTEAHFSSGLRKYQPDQKAFRPREMLYYFMNYEQEPSFIVDVTKYWDTKIEAISAHESQFGRRNPMFPTEVNSRFPGKLEGRFRHYGSFVNARYGEAFVVRNMLAVQDPMEFFS